MRTIRYTIIFTLILGFLGLISCEDDLNVEPRNTQSEIDFLSNPTNAINLVNGVYAKNYDWNMYSFSWLGVASIASDEADKGSSPGDTGADKHKLDALDFTPEMLSIQDIWKGRYDGIYRVNNALKYLPLLNIPTTLRDRLIGEVKFLRALWYFDLVRVFGGVPVVPFVVNPQDINQVNQVVFTRKTRAETLTFIEQDLLDAIGKLPMKNQYAAQDLGRATKEAAQALLAKVYLYQERWNDAFQMAGNVIATGNYSLMPNYADVWKEVGENGPESIFEIQATLDRGLDNWCWVQGGRGTPDFGWGFNSPSTTLFNSYEPGDTRRAATIMISGQTLWDGFVTPVTWANPRYNYKAYQSRTMESWNGNTAIQAKNYRVIKYSEVLLIRAEAAFRIGNISEALARINQLRNRAGLPSLGTITLNQIFKERWHEMAMENDRWFDIIRTGQAQAAMAADGKTFIVGKHEVYPIPLDQIAQSGGLLQQNPGY